MNVIFTAPRPLKSILPWVVTAALLLVWSFAAVTANRMDGFVNGFLIAGAVMVMVSLFLGRKVITLDASN